MAGLSSSIQFRDGEAVLSAFENRKVEAWSISQGKQFMFKGIGSEDLRAVIETLSDSFSSATYTLRVYEDLKYIKEIKSNTPDDGSFNFKFNEDLKENYRVMGGGPTSYSQKENNLILSKLAGIEERLNREEMEEPEENKTPSLGIIGDILAHPAIAPIAPTLIQTFLEFITGKAVPGNLNNNQNLRMAPEMINSNSYQSNSISGINEDQQLNEAIIKLKSYDSNLLQHLQKLIVIAENDNTTFNLIIKSLD